MNQKNADLLEKLKQQEELKEFNFTDIIDYICIEVFKEKLLNTAKFLKEKMGFSLLIDIAGIDRFTRKDRFELMYNMYNIDERLRLFMRTKLDSKKPIAESVTPVWAGANWMEREAYDMYGIKFKNHPDHRRLYLADEFEYHPLRKDFPLMGIPGSFRLPKK